MPAVTEQLNQYEWMLLNGDKLAALIKEDGGMSGPKADPLLTEVQRLDSSGRIRQQARELLKWKLDSIGAGHLFTL